MKRNLLPMSLGIALLLAAPCLSVTASAALQDKPESPKIVRKTTGVLQGSVTRRVEPTYPPLAKTARVGGPVVVEVTVDEEGKVIAARSLSGHPLLRDAAVTAARDWEFTPTQLNGQPVKVIGTINFYFQPDSKERIEELKQEIAKRPSDPELYAELGHWYVNAGDYERALEACQQALALKPDYARAWLNIAGAYERMRRPGEAIDAYRRFLELDPDSPDAVGALLIVATISFNNQRYQEAIDAIKQLVPKRPDTDVAYVMLARCYLKLGDKQSAQAQYQVLKERKSPMADEVLSLINGQQ